MQIPVTETDGMAIKSCRSDSHGVTAYDPSPGHCPMGLSRSLDLRWMEKMAGGKKSWMIEWYVVKCRGQKLQLGNGS